MNNKILIVAHFCDFGQENTNNRFNYIVKLLKENGYEVELITSSFSHRDKKQRNCIDKGICKTTLINEPSYKKNISIKRFYSHYTMSKNLKKYLRENTNYDSIYCAVPSLDVAYEVSKFAMKNNIKFIIDVQDLWPEAFKMVFNVPIISDLIFNIMKKKADLIYSSADKIIAVSQTYADRAKSVNKKSEKALSVFLGTELSQFDKYANDNLCMLKPSNEIWIVYIGTLGHSYDINCVTDALSLIKDKGINNIKFLVMGDGPLRDKFEDYAYSKGINIEFTGRLTYPEMVKRLCVCDIAVNPIPKGVSSIINKVGDYAAASLPVINTQECSEYRMLLENYNCGLNCNNDFRDLAKNILKLYKDSDLRKIQGSNNRTVAEKYFDRNITYKKLLMYLLRGDM